MQNNFKKIVSKHKLNYLQQSADSYINLIINQNETFISYS